MLYALCAVPSLRKENPMFKTRLTELLEIQYPIIQGGLLWTGRRTHP
jgi:hypothetical protein